MSLYTSLRNTSLDLFIAYHPKVIEFKRKAKLLHKELKSTGVSLMQSQEIIAKEHGFNNWYHFMVIIKKHYHRDLEDIPFIITKTIDPISKNFLLGYDTNFDYYKWQDKNASTTHRVILGKSVYKSYDLFIAKQAIDQGQPVIFFNGQGDGATLDKFVNATLESGRGHELVIINLGESKYPKYERKLAPLLEGSASALTSQMALLLDVKEVSDTNFTDKEMGDAINILSFVFMGLAHKQIPITFENLKRYMVLENLIELAESITLKHIHDGIKNYFLSLQNDDNFAIHSKTISHILPIIDTLLTDSIFNINGLSVNNLLSPHTRPVYIVQFAKDTHPLVVKFIMSSLKVCAPKYLGAPLDSAQPMPRLYTTSVFIRQCPLFKNFVITSSQMRSLGISINFSYGTFDTLKQIVTAEEAFMMLQNYATKIISSQETEAFKYLTRHLPEYQQEQYAPNKYSVTITSTEAPGGIWLIKEGDVSQISFKEVS